MYNSIPFSEPHMTPTDYQKPFISWCANSDEFVVSYVKENVREFKIFDASCKPKALSEFSKGLLYGAVAWKPEGNIIAAAMFIGGQSYIGIFEKNGLFRLHFPLVDVYVSVFM